VLKPAGVDGAWGMPTADCHSDESQSFYILQQLTAMPLHMTSVTYRPSRAGARSCVLAIQPSGFC
jgi:hypothetical protein